MAIFRVGFFQNSSGVTWSLSGRIGMECVCFNPQRGRHVTTDQRTSKSTQIEHHFIRQDGAADIELGPENVVRRFDDAALAEMLDLIEPLVEIIKPAHNYLELNSPAETLIMSVDERTHGGTFAEFPHGEPVPPPADPQTSTAG